METPRFDRRRALSLLGGAGLLALVGCDSDDDATTTTTDSTGTTGTTSADTTGAAGTEAIPEETAGPFPGDGTNGPNVLAEEGVVRSDIRSSFGSMSGTAAGVDLALALKVVDAASGDPIDGAAVYAWHCDAVGGYSLYDAVADQNYLRGVQAADGNGDLAFLTVFPGVYPGRWPHVHFEAYRTVDEATGGGTPIATSQLALPQDTCEEVFEDSTYGDSADNLAATPLDDDMVFSDGYDNQLATISGDVGNGLTATLTIGV